MSEWDYDDRAVLSDVEQEGLRLSVEDRLNFGRPLDQDHLVLRLLDTIRAEAKATEDALNQAGEAQKRASKKGFQAIINDLADKVVAEGWRHRQAEWTLYHSEQVLLTLWRAAGRRTRRRMEKDKHLQAAIRRAKPFGPPEHWTSYRYDERKRVGSTDGEPWYLTTEAQP